MASPQTNTQTNTQTNIGTTGSFDVSKLAASEPSLCIPRVFSNINDGRVFAIIRELGWGEVEKVDMVHKENDAGEEYQRVFIHFRRWNTDDETNEVRADLMRGDPIKVVYDNPWYWMISKSRATRPDNRSKKGKGFTGGARKPRSKPFVSRDGWTSVPVHNQNKDDTVIHPGARSTDVVSESITHWPTLNDAVHGKATDTLSVREDGGAIGGANGFAALLVEDA